MPIDNRLLRLEIERNSEAIYRLVKPQMEERFAELKDEMLADYDENEVTKALVKGAEDPTQSDGFVESGTGEGGNLFSALGFNDGEDPAGVVRTVLEEDSKINASQYSRDVGPNTITFKVPIHISALSTFNNKVADELSLDWTDRPFPDVIEKGIPGLPQYLFDPERNPINGSRSGPAVQLNNGGKLKGGSIGPIRWISEVLAEFKRNISASS